MNSRSKPWLHAAAFALTPLVLLIPVIRMADFASHELASVLPILIYTSVAMWMESRSIALLLVTCQGRRDPFLIAAVPLGIAALAAYVCSAVLFAMSIPTLLRLI
jgi:hypothetical protein